jgi:BNR repeat-like domain
MPRCHYVNLRGRTAVVVACLPASVCLALGLSPAASASGTAVHPVVVRIHDVAGRSPYIGRHCNAAPPEWRAAGGKEGEPLIAVNPKNANNRIAVWMDRTRASMDTAYTVNGGLTWTKVQPAGLDACGGNHTQPWEASGDPWVSFGPDGVAYFTSLVWAHFNTPPFKKYVSILQETTSFNGGKTWTTPVLLSAPNAVSDKDANFADPNHPGTDYAAWRNQGFGLVSTPRAKTELLFAKTTDWGAHWTAPIVVDTGTLRQFFGTPQVVALANGTIVVTSSLTNSAGVTQELAFRSTDGGTTWSAPIVINDVQPSTVPPVVCGTSYAAADTTSSSGQDAAVSGNSIVLVTQDSAAASAGRGGIILSRSNDGGMTWSNVPVFESRYPVTFASVAGNAAGRLALVWDENNIAGANCAANKIPARTLFATSSDGGATWQSTIAGAPWWNLATTKVHSSGYYPGDYQAVAATPRGFTTVAVNGKPLVASASTAPITGDTGVVVADIKLFPGNSHR